MVNKTGEFIDQSSPLSYDPSRRPDPATWLGLDEAERIGLVEDYVYANEPEVGGISFHIHLHAVIENQIALRDETPVEAACDRLMADGLNRHEAIHALATRVLPYVMSTMREDGSFTEDDYHASVRSFSVEQWYQEFEDGGGEVGKSYGKSNRKTPRNAPCPCGSGKKYKRCCG